MKQLEKTLIKLNKTSLAKVHFLIDKLNENSFDFYNIVFTGGGVYIVLKTDFGISIDKLQNIQYSNSQLVKFKTDTNIIQSIQKPNISIFIKIIEIFKYVYNRIKSEVCVNVYFDKISGLFRISIDDQIVSEITASYNYNKKFEMSKDYIRYLQIHSHHTMAASFSSQDDHDEESTSLCYYGVVGKLNSNSSFYNVDSKFRYWNGIRFVNIEFSNVFDTGINILELTENDIIRLNTIIENSEKKKQEKVGNQGGEYHLSGPPFDVNNFLQSLLMENSFE